MDYDTLSRTTMVHRGIAFIVRTVYLTGPVTTFIYSECKATYPHFRFLFQSIPKFDI